MRRGHLRFFERQPVDPCDWCGKTEFVRRSAMDSHRRRERWGAAAPSLGQLVRLQRRREGGLCGSRCTDKNKEAQSGLRPHPQIYGGVRATGERQGFSEEKPLGPKGLRAQTRFWRFSGLDFQPWHPKGLKNRCIPVWRLNPLGRKGFEGLKPLGNGKRSESQPEAQYFEGNEGNEHSFLRRCSLDAVSREVLPRGSDGVSREILPRGLDAVSREILPRDRTRSHVRFYPEART